jgi:hypothetical protein
MAHLLNSGGDKADYSLSRLVHEYLHEDYPLWMQHWVSGAFTRFPCELGLVKILEVRRKLAHFGLKYLRRPQDD